MRRVPLAWCNLVHEPSRLVRCCGGVAFAVVLMFMQYGFRNALLDSMIGNTAASASHEVNIKAAAATAAVAATAVKTGP